MVSTAGDAFSIKAPVTGYEPEFQWSRNGDVIAGETGSVYSVTSAGTIDAGTYTVTARNKWPDGTTSEWISEQVVAQVKINSAPVLTFPSEPILVNEGTAFTITGTLSGTVGNARYQWRKDGKAIANAFGTVFVTDAGVSVSFYRAVAAAGDGRRARERVAQVARARHGQGARAQPLDGHNGERRLVVELRRSRRGRGGGG